MWIRVQLGDYFTHCQGQFTKYCTWQKVLIHTGTLMPVNEAIRILALFQRRPSRLYKHYHHGINSPATEIKEVMEIVQNKCCCISWEGGSETQKDFNGLTIQPGSKLSKDTAPKLEMSVLNLVLSINTINKCNILSNPHTNGTVWSSCMGLLSFQLIHIYLLFHCVYFGGFQCVAPLWVVAGCWLRLERFHLFA